MAGTSTAPSTRAMLSRMREKELRLALVCYGGISLAVYMHGITREVWKLLRASRAWHDNRGALPEGDTEPVYFRLLKAVGEHVDLRVLVDIIAGASAGGINGIFLAHAISTGQDLEALSDLWLDKADVDELLDPAAAPGSRWSKFYAAPFLWLIKSDHVDMTHEVVEAGAKDELKQKLSRFIRSRWFQPPFSGAAFTGFLLDAFERMEARPAGPPLLPPGQPLDLFVTVTDFFGHPERLRLNSPAEIVETEHRKIIGFRDEGARGENRQLSDPPSLVFAARATASFPGAFPPFQPREIDEVLEGRGLDWPTRARFLASVFPLRSSVGFDIESAPLLDGSVLNNAPFRPAIGALKNRPAHREIDRRFVYIDPKPGIRSIGAGALDPTKPPGFFSTIIRSLSDIPREQPIRDDLEALQGLSRRVRRMRHVLDGIRDSVEAVIDDAIGTRALGGRITPAKLKALRDRANAEAVARAGFAYPGYAHLKLSQVAETMAAMIADLGTHQDAVAADHIRANVWQWLRESGIESITRTVKPKLAERDAFVGFLRRYDLGFRVRRLRFIIRRLNEMTASESFAEAAAVERLKTAAFELLAPFLDRRSANFYGPFVREPCGGALDDCAGAIAAYGEAMGLSAFDALSDARLSAMLAGDVPERLRHGILRAYLGFPFYDIATFPMLQGEGLDEYDEIKVDRISPDDATSIREGGAQATLKGIRFNSFGAFFSRAYRENDYLWGRLHGAERLIDIVTSSLPAGKTLPPGLAAALKTEAFRSILKTEGPRLTAVPELIDSLMREVG